MSSMCAPLRITLNGALGSGKTTIGRRLAAHFGIDFISTGTIFREIGRISSLDALQTNLAAENNAEIDRQVDDFIQELAATDRSFVIDSRMAWHFIADSIDIYLGASPEIAARRVFQDRDRVSEHYRDLDEARRKIADRRQSEIRRYRTLYGVDIDARRNFSLLIDTDSVPADAILERIIAHADSVRAGCAAARPRGPG